MKTNQIINKHWNLNKLKTNFGLKIVKKMKKLMMLIALITLTISVSAQVIYHYDEAYCWDIYERYIPSGYFDGPNGEIIHYYGEGDFFVGYPQVRNPRSLSDYHFVVVHMDFRPLHRMVLSRGFLSIGAVHISFDNDWIWSISYSNVTYNNRHYPELHFYGNNSKWRYYANLARGYNYYDWDYSYVDLVWRDNYRPKYYSHFRNRHGDCRRHQYSGSSNYGYRSYYNNDQNERGLATNQRNPKERRMSSETIDVGRNRISQEIETSKRGYTTKKTTREVFRNGLKVDSQESGNYSDEGRDSYSSERREQTRRLNQTTPSRNDNAVTSNNSDSDVIRGSGQRSRVTKTTTTETTRNTRTSANTNSHERRENSSLSSTRQRSSERIENVTEDKIMYEDGTTPRQRSSTSSSSVNSNKTSRPQSEVKQSSVDNKARSRSSETSVRTSRASTSSNSGNTSSKETSTRSSSSKKQSENNRER